MAKEYITKLGADIRGYLAGFRQSIRVNDEFSASLNRVADQTRIFGNHARVQTNIAGKALAGFAVGSGVSLTAVYNRQSELIDQTAKTADRLGVTTEALTGLHHASEQNGVSSGEFDKSLQRMVRRLGEIATKGQGEAKIALDELGISIDELKGRRADEQFALIADKMRLVEDQGKKVFLTQKLFDSEGVALINTLNMGADGIRDMIQEAELLGLTFSRIDAARVEMANDEFDRAQKTLTSFSNQLANEVSPLIGALSQSWIENAKEAGGFGNIATSVVDNTAGAVGVLANGVHGIMVLWKASKTGVLGFGSAGAQTFTFLINDTIIPFANAISNGVLYPIRQTLELLSQLPSVGDTARAALRQLDGVGQIGAVESLEEFSRSAVALFEDAKADLHQTMLEPMPKERIEQYIADAREKFTLAAKESVKAGNATVGDFISSDGEEQAPRAPANDEDRRLVDSARQRYAAIYDEQLKQEERETELENRRYERQRAQMEKELELLRERGLLTKELEAEFRTAREQAESQHNEKLKEIEADKNKFLTDGFNDLLGAMSNYFGGMEGTHAKYAKAAISIGQTLMDEEKRKNITSIMSHTYDTAMKAYNALAPIPVVGPVLGAGAAAAVLVAGTGYAAKVSGLASFKGGGETPDLPRYGGIDGYGGFLAVLHGHEQVIDKTLPASANAGTSSQTFNINAPYEQFESMDTWWRRNENRIFMKFRSMGNRA